MKNFQYFLKYLSFFKIFIIRNFIFVLSYQLYRYVIHVCIVFFKLYDQELIKMFCNMKYNSLTFIYYLHFILILIRITIFKNIFR